MNTTEHRPIKQTIEQTTEQTTEQTIEVDNIEAKPKEKFLSCIQNYSKISKQHSKINKQWPLKQLSRSLCKT